jgi:hypothetical protein
MIIKDVSHQSPRMHAWMRLTALILGHVERKSPWGDRHFAG